MIKIFCDICGKEPQMDIFSCEITKQEIITDLTTGQKQLKKDLLQVCKKCYDKEIKPKIRNKN